jgi:hypothetical protein
VQLPATKESNKDVEDPVESDKECPFKCEFCTSDDSSSSSDSVYSSPDEEDLSLGKCVQLVSDAVTSFKPADRSAPIMCQRWQTSGAFSDKGGVLRKPGSEVELHVPPKAVKKGKTVKVDAAVCADLELLHRKLKELLPPEEQIVTPLAEYSADQKNWKFDRPVTIYLPHLMKSDFDKSHVHAYCITRDENGKIVCSKVDFSVSKDREFLVIRTNHFSGYTCTSCLKKAMKMKYLPDLYVRGSGTLMSFGNDQHVNVDITFGDKRIIKPDFSEVRVDHYYNFCFSYF